MTVSPMSLPLGAEIFLTVVLAGIIVVAIIGNSMVCMAITRSRTLRAQVSNVFIANLAITDLGCASLVMPFSLISVWFDHWIFGSFLCDAVCFFNYCFIIVSMLSLALISIDRHIYVVYPFRYTSAMTHRRAIALVICTWLVGFVFASAPPFMRWVIYDNAEIICAVNWESNHHQVLAYTVSAFVICFMTPIVVMGYCYIGIYRVAKSHAKRIAPPQLVGHISAPENTERHRCNSMSNADGSSLSQENGSALHQASAQSSQKKSKWRPRRGSKPKTPAYYSSKAIRSILVMILSYLICNTPFSLTKLLKVINMDNEAVPFYINTAASWFGFINPCCNPIIYSILREDFRVAFIRLLPRVISRRLQSDMDSAKIQSFITRNSPKSAQPSRCNVSVNIIQASPIKRPPTLIENPLRESSVNLSHDNANANNGNTNIASSADHSPKSQRQIKLTDGGEDRSVISNIKEATIKGLPDRSSAYMHHPVQVNEFRAISDEECSRTVDEENCAGPLERAGKRPHEDSALSPIS